ncbi:hypothetical protein, partial [Klebsiella pneumoniae]
ALWAGIAFSNPGQEPRKLSKYEADQFVTDLTGSITTPLSVIESLRASPSPFFPDPLLPGGATGFDTDPETDDLYVPGA